MPTKPDIGSEGVNLPRLAGIAGPETTGSNRQGSIKSAWDRRQVGPVRRKIRPNCS